MLPPDIELYTQFHAGQLSSDESGDHSPIFGALHGQVPIDSLQHACYVDSTSLDYNFGQPSLERDHHQYATFAYPPRVYLSQDRRVQPDWRESFHSERMSSPGTRIHVQPPSILQQTMPMDNPSSSIRTTEPSQKTHSPGVSSSSAVVIACRQCRLKKVRCDSTRPVCRNCDRRGSQCAYDAAPKRRGPDKEPGTRRRSCKKRPATESSSVETPPPPRKRARRASPEPVSSPLAPVPGPSFAPRPSLVIDTRTHNPIQQHLPDLSELTPLSAPQYQPLPVVVKKTISPMSSSSELERKLFWDDLLREYSGTTRENSLLAILEDLSFLFDGTNNLLAFVYVPPFLEAVKDPHRRLSLQPSFILAALALSTLMKSSVAELGNAGSARALWLRLRGTEQLDLATLTAVDPMIPRDALLHPPLKDISDPMLAGAALILAIFESCPHPEYDHVVEAIAVQRMDRIITKLGLTRLDEHDSDVCQYDERQVPRVFIDDAEPLTRELVMSDDLNMPIGASRTCACLPPESVVDPMHYAASWSYTMPWDETWTAEETSAEGSRRLCWSALSIVSLYTSQCSALSRIPAHLELTESSNFRLLFPGEVMDRRRPDFGTPLSISPKDSVWALYCRAMLLWNFCGRIPTGTYNDEEKGALSQEAWQETQALEDALDAHVCNLDTNMLYMCREYLSNSRMSITQALRRLSGLDSGDKPSTKPTFNRKQANEWLHYQHKIIQIAQTSIATLNTAPHGHVLTRRPFQVSWFYIQLVVCIGLFEHDPGMALALDLAKAILEVVDVTNTLWPCPERRRRVDGLRQALIVACEKTHIPLPRPVSLSLPRLLIPFAV